MRVLVSVGRDWVGLVGVTGVASDVTLGVIAGASVDVN